MTKSGFTTPQILIFLLALVVVVGGYFAFGTKTPAPQAQTQTPTPTPTSTPSIVSSSIPILSVPMPSAPTSSAVVPSASVSNLQIIWPAGGEQWKAGDNYFVRWTGRDFLGSKSGYNFELSLMQGDRGNGIIVSVDNAPMSGSDYLWTIPKDTPSGIYEITIVESRLLQCPTSVQSLCRQSVFQSQSKPFTIIQPAP